MKSNKIKTLINHSLLVGILSGIVGTGFGAWLNSNYKSLSYVIERVDKFFDKNETDLVEVSVNGTPVKEVFCHRVKIWNSGNLPIKNIPLTFIFLPDSQNIKDFKLLSLNYDTIPEYEFGKISELKRENMKARLIVDLLNPGDSVDFQLLTNQMAPLSFYSKSEGVSVEQGRNSFDSWIYWNWWILAFAAIFGLFLFFFEKAEKKKRHEELMLFAQKMSDGTYFSELETENKITDNPETK